MERSLLWLFCLLTLMSIGSESSKPEISIEMSNMTVMCKGGKFDHEIPSLTEAGSSGLYTCSSEDCSDPDNCPSAKVLVKILSSENLIQVEKFPLVAVLMGNIFATGLIGLGVYCVCSDPNANNRSNNQSNKDSDRRNLISNSAADTYQPLSNRSDEYSTLHGPGKNKNPKHPI